MLGKNCDAINEWIKELKTQKVIEKKKCKKESLNDFVIF